MPFKLLPKIAYVDINWVEVSTAGYIVADVHLDFMSSGNLCTYFDYTGNCAVKITNFQDIIHCLSLIKNFN
jgi:hypothetical protein